MLTIKLKMYGVPGSVQYFGRDIRWCNSDRPYRIFRPNMLAIACEADEIETKIDEYISIFLKWDVVLNETF